MTKTLTIIAIIIIIIVILTRRPEMNSSFQRRNVRRMAQKARIEHLGPLQRASLKQTNCGSSPGGAQWTK